MMEIDPFDEQKVFYQNRYSDLLAVLQKHGQWITRYEIAAALGVNRFNGNHILAIEALEAIGLIETRRVALRRWEYRIKP